MVRKIVAVIFFLIVLAWVIGMNTFMNFRTPDGKLKSSYAKKSIDLKVHHIKIDHKSIRYLETGSINPADPAIIFIHGAPGSAEGFNKYLQDTSLIQKARLIALDRLGYGFSELGQEETTTDGHAKTISAMVSQLPNEQIILVGHSYGGPIAARYAIDNPEKVNGILMVAPVNDPKTEVVFWYAYFGKWKLTRWMVSKALRVATDEKFAHIDELIKMEADWKNLSTPVVHVHGTNDGLASFENMNFSKINILNALLKQVPIESGNHLIIWNKFEIIKEELHLIIDGLGGKSLN